MDTRYVALSLIHRFVQFLLDLRIARADEDAARKRVPPEVADLRGAIFGTPDIAWLQGIAAAPSFLIR